MKLYCIYSCVYTQNYIYPFQNLSLGFFLKFRKFQHRYSYKIYSYTKNECIWKCSLYRIIFLQNQPRFHMKCFCAQTRFETEAQGDLERPIMNGVLINRSSCSLQLNLQLWLVHALFFYSISSYCKLNRKSHWHEI